MVISNGGYIFQADGLLCQPLTIGAPVSVVALEFFVRNHSALFKVDKKHFARLESTLEFDVRWVHRQHTDFRCHDDFVVMGDIVTAGS